MLGYRHAFHAGNFADVLKHVVLVALIEALARKDAPFCCLDTHAGAGTYDLASREARRNREHAHGLVRVLAAANVPPLVARYVATVRGFDTTARRAVRHYPGSPAIALALMRAGDRMIACERHPADAAALKACLRGEPRAQVHARDGYEAIGALLPPHERRGMVLIDPSYETDDEIDRIAAALATARTRWPTGVFAVWYPLLAHKPVERLVRAAAGGDWRRVLRAEVRVRPADAPLGLNGAGMLVLNTPWRLDEDLTPSVAWLAGVLADGDRDWKLDWLIPD